jgi:hypothetical protein
MLPFQLSTVYLCTTWRLDPKALALLPSFLHCGFLAACAKDMVFQGLTCLLPWTPKLGDSKYSCMMETYARMVYGVHF